MCGGVHVGTHTHLVCQDERCGGRQQPHRAVTLHVRQRAPADRSADARAVGVVRDSVDHAQEFEPSAEATRVWC
eukprot:154868-Chlamydomonas_euryale.AAC.1